MIKQPKKVEYRTEYEPNMTRIGRALPNNEGDTVVNYNNSKLTVEEAAQIMRVTPQFLRIGLQQNRFPFGAAIRMKRWAYYINSARFSEYMLGR